MSSFKFWRIWSDKLLSWCYELNAKKAFHEPKAKKLCYEKRRFLGPGAICRVFMLNWLAAHQYQMGLINCLAFTVRFIIRKLSITLMVTTIYVFFNGLKYGELLKAVTLLLVIFLQPNNLICVFPLPTHRSYIPVWRHRWQMPPH